MIRFSDVGDIIRTQNKKMQLLYQDALTATFSHEQMNPLNSIINLTTNLQQHFEQQQLLVEGMLAERSCMSRRTEEMDNLDSSLTNIKDQLHIVRMILNSSVMMHILNAAILNSRRLKANIYIPKLERVNRPAQIMEKLLLVFEDQIQ